MGLSETFLCLIFKHEWSDWKFTSDKTTEYRYCVRCDATEEKIGLKVVRRGNILKWLISLGKPSLIDSLERANEETLRQWYYHIPRDELNSASKCLVNELKNVEDFPPSKILLCNKCGSCRYHLFCNSILRSMEKAFNQYERKGEPQTN